MSKKAEEKYDPTFVHRSLFQAISAVRKYGIEKHGNRDDWLTTPSNEHFKSAQRHLTAAIAGEAFDMESGLPHIAMCVTNLMFEIERGNLTFERKLESSKEQERYDIKAKPNAKLEIGSTEQLIEEIGKAIFMHKNGDEHGAFKEFKRVAEALSIIDRP